MACDLAAWQRDPLGVAVMSAGDVSPWMIGTVIVAIALVIVPISIWIDVVFQKSGNNSDE